MCQQVTSLALAATGLPMTRPASSCLLSAHRQHLSTLPYLHAPGAPCACALQGQVHHPTDASDSHSCSINTHTATRWVTRQHGLGVCPPSPQANTGLDLPSPLHMPAGSLVGAQLQTAEGDRALQNTACGTHVAKTGPGAAPTQYSMSSLPCSPFLGRSPVVLDGVVCASWQHLGNLCPLVP